MNLPRPSAFAAPSPPQRHRHAANLGKVVFTDFGAFAVKNRAVEPFFGAVE
jgi:hypothetical protein